MAIREVRDRDGCLWTVWDTYPESTRRVNVMPGFQVGWLTFECDGAKWRVNPVPPGWTDASEMQLLGWLAAAKLSQPQLRQGGDT